MEKWEYLILPLQAAGRLGDDATAIRHRQLNELGSEGWEAVGITLKNGTFRQWPVVLLKRPIDNQR